VRYPAQVGLVEVRRDLPLVEIQKAVLVPADPVDLDVVVAGVDELLDRGRQRTHQTKGLLPCASTQ
jgi:hypothetical protein